MNRPVTWGIVGTGLIARRFAAAVNATPGARLGGVASRSHDRARAFAAEFACGEAYGSYEELAQSDVDIVYIATPQSRHVDDATLALEAGKHVLVEKPFSMSAADAQRLSELADRSSLLAVEAMWTHFNPLISRLVALQRAGRLGSLRTLTANCGPFGVPRGHRALDPDLGASFLWECLIYPLAVLTAVDGDFHDPLAIQATLLKSDRDVDFAGSVVLTTKSAFAQLGGGIQEGARGGVDSRLQFSFDRAWAETNDLYSPSEMRIGWVGGAVERHGAPAIDVGLGYEVDALSRAVLGKQRLPEYARLSHTVRTLRLLERIAASAALIR